MTFDTKNIVLGLRPTAHLTAAQAYAARWDLSPNPSPRTQLPIIPREAIIEPPYSPRNNIEHNLFTPKFSSLKDRRSQSKVTPFVDYRSWTLDDTRKAKDGIEKKEGATMDASPKPTNQAVNSLISTTELFHLRPKSTPGCALTNSDQTVDPPLAPSCQQ